MNTNKLEKSKDAKWNAWSNEDLLKIRGKGGNCPNDSSASGQGPKEGLRQ